MTLTTSTRRPRNVNAPRAAAILYGDWGTSKAYVIGIAFAVGGYSSFWLIAAMCVLTALVGVNYMAICKHYPDGGGVYASVRHRSEIISIVGAFLLIADYIVTAAISALSAFQYLQIPHPVVWAGLSILFIGGLNYFGPKHTGGLAFLVSLPTVVVVVVLGAFCIPHLGEAVHNMQPLQGGFFKNWGGFVGVVLALSGVEAIANSTGVMKLNKGSTDAQPNVSQTSTPAILWVMLEVCLFTALLGLAMNALGGLASVPTDTGQMNEVNAPGNPGVRDYMLRYMGGQFVGGAFHSALIGHYMGVAVSLVFGLLLLSAVNTAIVDLVAISFLMSRDEELPPHFQRLNSFGVPNLGLIVAAVVPALLVLTVKDVGGLADLYAVGVVGAIATNLGASSTDRKLGLAAWERLLMFCTFLIMLAIELTLFADKPSARNFAAGVLVIGLILRGLAIEHTRRKLKEEQAAASQPAAATQPVLAPLATLPVQSHEASGTPMMCAVRGLGKTLDFAIEEARQSDRPLYLLFIRPVPVLLADDFKRKWQDDPEARVVFLEAKKKAGGHPVIPCYAVSDSVAHTIVDITATVGVSHLILGAPERRGLAHLLRGNIIREISDSLPEDIHLIVYA
ncbi:MAG: universal stress protein [Verrucomicrobiota bacterium]|jgi:amino acid transporter/nucleotide-binding universal stress UspA family protein